MAVPVRADLLAELLSKARRALACWSRGMETRRTELRAATRALPSADELLALPRQRLDACADRLPRALRANAQIHHTDFSRIAARLTPQTLRSRLAAEQERVVRAARGTAQCLRVHVERRRDRFDALSVRLGSAMRSNAQSRQILVARQRERTNTLYARIESLISSQLERRSGRLDRASGLLSAFSYRGTLARGFALVRDASGTPLRSAQAVSAGTALDIEFADGHVSAAATSGSAPRAPSAPASAPKPKVTPGSGGQGDLF
jgi:exodeoxyribonuclease VII large subunit